MPAYTYSNRRTGHGPRRVQRPPPPVRERANLVAPIFGLVFLATVVLVSYLAWGAP